MFRTHFDEQSKLWSGAAIPQLFNTKVSIAQVLLRSMKIYGSKIAQVSMNESLTYNCERSCLTAHLYLTHLYI